MCCWVWGYPSFWKGKLVYPTQQKVEILWTKCLSCLVFSIVFLSMRSSLSLESPFSWAVLLDNWCVSHCLNGRNQVGTLSFFQWWNAGFALRTGYNDMCAQKEDADPKQGSQSGSFAQGPNRFCIFGGKFFWAEWLDILERQCGSFDIDMTEV